MSLEAEAALAPLQLELEQQATATDRRHECSRLSNRATEVIEAAKVKDGFHVRAATALAQLEALCTDHSNLRGGARV